MSYITLCPVCHDCPVSRKSCSACEGKGQVAIFEPVVYHRKGVSLSVLT